MLYINGKKLAETLTLSRSVKVPGMMIMIHDQLL